MEKFGVLDIGSNSVKISVFDFSQKKIKICGEFNEVTKLAENTENSGLLQERAEQRTLFAIEQLYLKVEEQFPNIKIFPFATAAVRDAKNKDEFARKFYVKFKQELQILSEPEEIKFVRLGAESEFDYCKKIISIDLGGGSTEVSIGEIGTENTIFAKSFPIGCVRFNNRFAMNEKVSSEFLLSAENFLQEVFMLVKDKDLDDYKVIFTGGTAVIFAKLVEKSEITIDDVDLWLKKLSQMSLAEKEKNEKIKSRATTLVAGILIIKHLLKLTKKIALVLVNVVYVMDWL